MIGSLKVGKKYKITKRNGVSKGVWEEQEGNLYSKDKDKLIFQMKNYKECFLTRDVNIGAIRLKEL